MMITGCDFHPRFEQIAVVDQETGEYGERRLCHRITSQLKFVPRSKIKYPGAES